MANIAVPTSTLLTAEEVRYLLEDSGEARRTARGFEMTPKGERRIRQDSLNEIFSISGVDGTLTRRVHGIPSDFVLFFDRDAALYVVAMNAATGAAAAMPRALPITGFVQSTGRRLWDLSADGSRFLMMFP